jgi:hypothetical protein
MAEKKIIAFFGLILIFVTALDAQMSRRQMQDMYVSYLKEQGYQPNIDSDGDVVFKAEGGTYYIIVDENDLGSFRILYPNFWSVESLDEKTKIYEVANYINRTTKVIKVFLNSRGDNTSMDVNIFIARPEDFKLHFQRMIDLLLSERREFREKMNE